MPTQIIIKLQIIRERKFWKNDITYRENGDSNDYRFLLRNHGGQTTVNDIFQVLKEKNYWHIILYPAKMSSRN